SGSSHPAAHQSGRQASSIRLAQASTAELISARYARDTPPPEIRQTSASPPHISRLRFSKSFCSSLLSFVLFHRSQHSVKPVVIFLQRLAQHPQPFIHRFNSRFCQTSGTSSSVNPPHNQPRIFEHLQMLRDRRLRHLERLCEFRHGGFSQRQARK